MKHLKKVLFVILFLEIFNLIIGIIYNGKDIHLPYSGFNDLPLYYDIDSLYGLTRQKNTKQIINHPWGGVVHQTNSLGFRDDEFSDRGILITGNSFIEGYGISKENRFSEILENKLKIPFNNAAFSGVWTPIQGLVLIENLIKTNKLQFDEIILFMTPSEVLNLGKRNPSNDPNRNYPYKQGDSISFYKAKNNSFKNSISFSDKIKRFCKSLLIFKVYNTFKYYRASKFRQKRVDFDATKLNWFIKEIENKKFKTKIKIVVLNNLGRISIKNIENFRYSSKNVQFHSIYFPDNLDNYFVSNGHLNEKGNLILAELLINQILNDK